MFRCATGGLGDGRLRHASGTRNITPTTAGAPQIRPLCSCTGKKVCHSLALAGDFRHLHCLHAGPVCLITPTTCDRAAPCQAVSTGSIGGEDNDDTAYEDVSVEEDRLTGLAMLGRLSFADAANLLVQLMQGSIAQVNFRL